MKQQPSVDLRDTRLALSTALDVLDWILVREKKRLGPQDVTFKLKEIELARALLMDEDESE
jgi:hypothetical protein